MSVAKGLLVAAFLITLLSLSSRLLLSHERLTEVLKDAFSSGELSSARSNPDWVEDWIECSMLTMEFARRDDALDAIDTKWIRPTHHTCDELKALVAGPPYGIQIAAPFSHINYPFGARHIEAIFLAALSFANAQRLCLILSYASLLCLLLSGWTNSQVIAATVLLPIVLLLAFAFEQHRFANNLMLAPVYFVGFFVLAAFLAAHEWCADRANRIAAFCFLGAMTAFLDTLHGGIPALISLTIVLNHFFYVSQEPYRSPADYGRNAVVEAVGVFACFFLGFVAITLVRLLLLSILDSQAIETIWATFLGGMTHRLGHEAEGAGTIGLLAVAKGLWAERTQMTGNAASTWIVIMSGAAWLAAIVSLIGLALRARGATFKVAVDIFVLLMAGLGIILWYVVFRNHSYVHPWFMVRLLALPAAYGVVAAILVAQAWRESLSDAASYGTESMSCPRRSEPS